MAKRPPPQSLFHRQVAVRWKRWSFVQKVSVIAALVVPITGAIVGIDKAWPVVRPAIPVVYYWFDLAQHENRKALDYLILKDERNELKDAQEDLRQNPGSRTAKDKVETFQQSIATREKRLRPVPGNDGGNW